MGRGEGQQYIREVVKGQVGYMEPEVESKQAKREEARESGVEGGIGGTGGQRGRG